MRQFLAYLLLLYSAFFNLRWFSISFFLIWAALCDLITLSRWALFSYRKFYFMIFMCAYLWWPNDYISLRMLMLCIQVVFFFLFCQLQYSLLFFCWKWGLMHGFPLVHTSLLLPRCGAFMEWLGLIEKMINPAKIFLFAEEAIEPVEKELAFLTPGEGY